MRYQTPGTTSPALRESILLLPEWARTQNAVTMCSNAGDYFISWTKTTPDTEMVPFPGPPQCLSGHEDRSPPFPNDKIDPEHSVPMEVEAERPYQSQLHRVGGQPRLYETVSKDTPLIPAFGKQKQRQADPCEFEASHTVKPCLKRGGEGQKEIFN